MKTEIEDYYTWDDVIFENRNRNYGAYLVRRSYSRNASIAFGASVSFAILLIFSPQIIQYLSGGKVNLPPIIKIEKPIIEIGPPPVIEIIQPVLPPPSAASVSTNLPLRVVTTETTTIIPPNNQLIVDAPSDGDGSVVFVEPSIGIAQAEVAPIVPKSPVDFAEEMPEYIGGRAAMMKLFIKNFKYPKSASNMGIEGSVFVSFVIDTNGNVADIKVVRGVSAECDKEAIRLISLMPQWQAGKQNHEPVAVRMILPIKFQINQ